MSRHSNNNEENNNGGFGTALLVLVLILLQFRSMNENDRGKKEETAETVEWKKVQ